MSRRKVIALCFVAIALIAGVIWWQSRKLEFIVMEIDTGFKGQALHQPWLMMQRLDEARNSGIHWQHRGMMSPDALEKLAENALVIAPPAALPQSRETVAQLEDWVSRGGLLLCGGTGSLPLDDSRVGKPLRQLLHLPAPPKEEHKFFESPEDKKPKPPTVSLDHKRGMASVDGLTWLPLEDAGQELPAAGGGSVLSFPSGGWRIPCGGGAIIVLPELNCLSNHGLKKSPVNADFALALLKGRGQVVTLRHAPSDGLFGWLIGPGLPALLAALAALSLFLWYRLPRFGPLLPDLQAAPAPALRLHLAAAARHLWRLSRYGRLLDPPRRRLKRELARQARPGETPESILVRLHQLQASQARHLLDEVPTSRAESSRILHHLNRILTGRKL